MRLLSPNKAAHATLMLERAHTEPTESIKTNLRFWRDALQVFLAVAFLMYGSSKLIGLQFSEGHTFWDKPIRDMSGMSLLWAFMAWSRSLQIVVGLGQISASLLLLRRQTALLGAILYLPLISVVVLFDVCYYVVKDATGMALVLFAGDLFLLWTYRVHLHSALYCLVGNAATNFPAVAASPETAHEQPPPTKPVEQPAGRTVGVVAAGIGIFVVVMALLGVCFSHRS